MTDQQLYLAIGMPTLVVLIGILVNFSAFGSLTNTMNSRFGSLESRMTSLETKLDSRILAFENKIENKIDLLTGKVIELDNRLTRLEERLKH